MSSAHATEHRFIAPLDVLFLRGNKLFGAPGSHGETQAQPWPSVVAGALRSQMLAHEGIDLAAFAQGQIQHPSLGVPAAPGSFALSAFTLARLLANGSLQTLHPLPADLVVSEKDGGKHHIQSLRPQAPHPGLLCSSGFAQVPVLAETERRKASSGLWLSQQGWQRYLNGQLPLAGTDLVHSSTLWAIDERVGIGLNADTRSADDGKLYSAQAVAFKPDVGFVVSVRGAAVPAKGTLRLGGDGRAAHSLKVAHIEPQPDLQAIAKHGRCRIVLTTPGVFAQGWLPNGFRRSSDASFQLDLCGVRARLVCATVPRSETISGWDLARWQPKTALRSAPIGSVYWLDQIEATEAALGNLAENGFWSDPCEDPHRRAEGFNRFAFAAYQCR